MAVSNKTPYRYNIYGAPGPLVQRLPVVAGATVEIKMGEICEIDTVSDTPDPVDGVTDNLHGLVIANEEQTAAGVARFMEFIIPRPGDVFEFALDAATAVKWGDELAFHSTDPSQTLAVGATDAVAWAVDVPVPAGTTGSTWPTISTVRVMFKKAGVGATGGDLPLIGAVEGDAA